MELPGFVLRGAPRTKKTHSRIVNIPMKGAHKCRLCGRMPGRPRLIPSEAHEEWFAYVQDQARNIVATLRLRGFVLPIKEQVSISAQIYRDRATGDACGYYQAIGDMLQAVGIIDNDALIEDWNGSRRLKDAADPRIEIYVTVLESKPAQAEMGLEV